MIDFSKKYIDPGDTVFAHDYLLHLFPKVLAYVFITRRDLDRADWMILHKDYIARFGPRIMRDLMRLYHAVFANEVFVVFLNKLSPAARRNGFGKTDPAPGLPVDFNPVHLEAVKVEVARLEQEALARLPVENALRSPFSRNYDPPRAHIRLARNCADYLFTPRTLVLTLTTNGGFFSNFQRVMGHLVYSLHHGGIRGVRVEWMASGPGGAASGPGDYHFPYGRPQDGNLWERFFEPIPTPIDPRWPVVKAVGHADLKLAVVYAHYTYRFDETWRRRYHSAFRRYIRVLPHIQAKVDAIHARMRGRHVIGVHMRNGGHKVEYFSGRAVGFETYISRIQELAASLGRDWAVFLATDVGENVSRFADIFGERLIVQTGVTRQPDNPTGDNNLQIHHNNPDPALKLGEDVLIDCLLLSKCDALVHSVSHVATAAGYMNPRMKMIYCQ